jgi:hypothetical protein
MAPLDPQRVHDALVRDLSTAGDRYALVRATREQPAARGYPFLLDMLAAGEGFELRVDGQPDMWFEAEIEHPGHLQAVVDQIQDVVMETETEPWPRCPLHYHALQPWPVRGWIVWRCPDTKARFATLGELGAHGSQLPAH